MVFMPVAMKDSLDVFLELAGAGVWDGGIMAQDTAFESTGWVTFHTEPSLYPSAIFLNLSW